MPETEDYNKPLFTDIAFLGVKFEGSPVSYISAAAFDAAWRTKVQWETFRHNLKFIISKCITSDCTWHDGRHIHWGIFEPDPRLGNVKLLLMPNEGGSVSLMLEEEGH